MERLMEMKRSGADDPEFGKVPTGRVLPARRGTGDDEPASSLPRRSPQVATDNEVFVPPFLGARVVKGIGLDDIAAYVNETALFRNQWQFRPEGGRATTRSRHESDQCCACSSLRRRRLACSCLRSSTASSP